MREKQHVVITFIVFGKGYDEVHEWIDSDAKNWRATVFSPYRHWIPYHNKRAIDEKYPEGDVRRTVAYLHVISDWMSHFGIYEFPLDEEEVQQLLWKMKIW